MIEDKKEKWRRNVVVLRLCKRWDWACKSLFLLPKNDMENIAPEALMILLFHKNISIRR
jgi:hypothetical protein